MAAGSNAVQAQATARLHTPQEMTDDEEMSSTRLSLQLGRVGVKQSPSCPSSSSAARPPSAPAPAPGAAHHGPRPRHMLTEAEKEEKRLRRVLANRESARQTILRRQAIRDELARKVADLSSQNETMKKEKDVVMKEHRSLKETNEQLKAQAHHLSLSLF
ncbi:transcriptional activator TAF-1-like [Miscanthus floridulus]|uniref:transcriptional activator TAF-1-like n=1 Tax=Miscanthus floridulus TaxID=154761 RepID=UPI00345AEB39